MCGNGVVVRSFGYESVSACDVDDFKGVFVASVFFDELCEGIMDGGCVEL